MRFSLIVQRLLKRPVVLFGWTKTEVTFAAGYRCCDQLFTDYRGNTSLYDALRRHTMEYLQEAGMRANILDAISVQLRPTVKGNHDAMKAICLFGFSAKKKKGGKNSRRDQKTVMRIPTLQQENFFFFFKSTERWEKVEKGLVTGEACMKFGFFSVKLFLFSPRDVKIFFKMVSRKKKYIIFACVANVRSCWLGRSVLKLNALVCAECASGRENRSPANENEDDVYRYIFFPLFLYSSAVFGSWRRYSCVELTLLCCRSLSSQCFLLIRGWHTPGSDKEKAVRERSLNVKGMSLKQNCSVHASR